jgi:hypothetical protein
MNPIAIYYKIYGIPNIAYFATLYQYMDWADALREAFSTDFKITDIIDIGHSIAQS